VPRVRKYLEEELHLGEAARANWVRHWLDAGSRAVEEVLARTRDRAFLRRRSVTIADICLAAHLTSAKCSAGAIRTTIRRPDDLCHCMAIKAFATTSVAPAGRPAS